MLTHLGMSYYLNSFTAKWRREREIKISARGDVEKGKCRDVWTTKNNEMPLILE